MASKKTTHEVSMTVFELLTTGAGQVKGLPMFKECDIEYGDRGDREEGHPLQTLALDGIVTFTWDEPDDQLTDDTPAEEASGIEGNN